MREIWKKKSYREQRSWHKANTWKKNTDGVNAIGSSSTDSRPQKNIDGANAIGSSFKDSRLKKKHTNAIGSFAIFNRGLGALPPKKSSYRCSAPEGATRRCCIWTILNVWRDNVFFWRFWRIYVSILGFYDPGLVPWLPLFRLFGRDYAMILGFDYFEEKLEIHCVLTILKGPKNIFFFVYGRIWLIFKLNPPYEM